MKTFYQVCFFRDNTATVYLCIPNHVYAKKNMASWKVAKWMTTQRIVWTWKDCDGIQIAMGERSE